MEFEPAYNDVAKQHISHDTTEISPEDMAADLNHYQSYIGLLPNHKHRKSLILKSPQILRV